MDTNFIYLILCKFGKNSQYHFKYGIMFSALKTIYFVLSYGRYTSQSAFGIKQLYLSLSKLHLSLVCDSSSVVVSFQPPVYGAECVDYYIVTAIS